MLSLCNKTEHFCYRIVGRIPQDQDAIFAQTVSMAIQTMAVNRVLAHKQIKDSQILAWFLPIRKQSVFANLVRTINASQKNFFIQILIANNIYQKLTQSLNQRSIIFVDVNHARVKSPF